MRLSIAVVFVAAIVCTGCGEGPYIVSTPPPPPPGLRMPSDTPPVSQAPPPTALPTRDNDVNATIDDVPVRRRQTSGSSGRTRTGGSLGRPQSVATTCTDPPPAPDAICMQACGEPVVHDNDPPPPFIWVTPAQAESRRKFGCPICLPEDARIATPNGQMRVVELRPGMPVFTLDEKGHRIAASVERVGSARVPASHRLVQIELSDGRTMRASPGHPTADGRLLGSLQVGERLDNATIIQSRLVPYGLKRTFDILPSGKTRAYWANDVLVGSTLRTE